MIPAALDTGSARCALAIGAPDVCALAEMIPIDVPADPAGRKRIARDIASAIVARGVTHLAIEQGEGVYIGAEWSPKKAGSVATNVQKSDRIATRVGVLCEEAGIVVTEIGHPSWAGRLRRHGKAHPPSLAEVTGEGTILDPFLAAHLPGWTERGARNADARDAAGLLLAFMLPDDGGPHKASRRGKGERRCHPDGSERYRPGKPRGPRPGPTKAERTLVAIRTVLAAGPLGYTALLRALGPLGHGLAFGPLVAAGVLVRLDPEHKRGAPVAYRLP